MHRCISSSRCRFLFFLARRSSQRDTQYPEHDPPKYPLNWYRPSNGLTSQQSGQLWWGLPWLCPGGADRAGRQFFQLSQQLCCRYRSSYANLSCSACHRQQQPACPLQQQQQQQQRHHQHDQRWEYGMSRWKYDCRGCDLAWRLGMVSVIGFRISLVCYFILGFVVIS